MAGNDGNGGSGKRTRSAAHALALLAAPLNSAILRCLADGPRQLAELQRETASPARSTLRAKLNKLVTAGVVAKRRRNGFPGVLDYELTESGMELLFVVDLADRWLSNSSEGPVALTDDAGRAALRALAAGWSTSMLRVLAAGPLTLTELDRVIPALSYPALERRLASLRLAGLVAPVPGPRRGTPHVVTAWARESVGPLIAAIRWEQRHLPDAPAIARLDVEGAFLLAAPLLEPPTGARGSFLLTVDLVAGEQPRTAGVVLALENGHVMTCSTRVEEVIDASVVGSTDAWSEAVLDCDSEQLRCDGDDTLPREVLDRLRQRLFGRTEAQTSLPHSWKP